MQTDDQFELIKWLLERQHDLRASTMDRASVIAAAAAFLVTGTTFLTERVSPNLNQPIAAKIFFMICISLALILLTLSILYAVSAAGYSIWKKPFKKYHIQYKELLFFSPAARLRHLRECIPTPDNFGVEVEFYVKEFAEVNKEKLIRYAVGDLIYGTKMHLESWNKLRLAMRLLFIWSAPQKLVQS